MDINISLSTKDLQSIQNTLDALHPDKLDQLLKNTVNSVASWTGTQIDNRIAEQLGIPKRLLKGRMIRNKSDNRYHAIRSSWLWYGGHRLSAGTLIKNLGLEPKFQTGRVQVGQFIWRDGFIKPGTKHAVMQREGSERYPFHAAMVDVSPLMEKAIKEVQPLINSKLVTTFNKQIEKTTA